MRIRWTPAAAADIEYISNYRDDQFPQYRQSTIRKLYDGILSLRSFPNRGKRGREDGTRELVYSPLPYVVAYRVKDQTIEVLRVYHRAQNRP